MKVLLIISSLIFLSFNSLSQEDKVRFTSINQVGLLSGNNGEAGILQTINGIKKSKWSGSLGTGLDFYKERTIPLFLDIRRDLSNKKNTPFIYADAGVNFLWLNSFQKLQRQLANSSPGLFYDLGIGWKLSGKNSRGYFFSAGYSLKQVKEKVRSSWWPAPTPQLDADNYSRYNNLYRRIVIKAGLLL